MTTSPIRARSDYTEAQQKILQLAERSVESAFSKNIAADAQFVRDHSDDADAFVPGTAGDVALQNLRNAIAIGKVRAAAPQFSGWKNVSFVRTESPPATPCPDCHFGFAQPEPDTVDPQMSRDDASILLVHQLFEGLLTIGEGANQLFAPGVADNFDVSPNKDVYVFHLRRNAKWSNGDAITTADFLYSWERCLNPANARLAADEMYGVKNARAYHERRLADFSQVGVRAIDAHTLQVTLEHPNPEFPIRLASQVGYFPVPRTAVETHHEQWTRPEHIVCNGAYCLTERTPEKYVLRKNEQYWDRAQTQVETITMYVASDEKTHLQWYESDEKKIDWVWRVPLGDIGRIQQEAASGARHDVTDWPGRAVYTFPINVRQPPFNDVRVRAALVAALDRRELARLFDNTVTPTANFLLPSFHTTHGYTAPPAPYLDRLAAKKLLAQAGFTAEHPLHFTMVYNTSEVHRPVAEYFQRKIEETFRDGNGKAVEVTVENMEWGQLLERVQKKDYQVTRMGMIPEYPSPLGFLEFFRTGNAENNPGYTNLAYDALLDTIEATGDPAQRNVLYARAESMLMRDWPVIPVFVYGGFQLVRDTMHGFDFTPTGMHLVKYVRTQ